MATHYKGVAHDVNHVATFFAACRLHTGSNADDSQQDTRRQGQKPLRSEHRRGGAVGSRKKRI